MKMVLPILAMVCTAGATLIMLVFMMAGAANAGPEQIRSMKRWAWVLGLLALIGVVAGIALLRHDRSTLAAVVAFAPTVVMGGALVVSLLK